ncbi:MAG: NAD(P)H-binding protein [Ferrimonas sp.]
MTVMSQTALTIVGCGWLGLPLALKLKQLGWQVSGSSRKPETLNILQKAGIGYASLSLDTQLHCADPRALFQAPTLLISVPPGCQQQTNSYAKRMDLLVRAARQHGITQALFISSTSVYQDGDNFPVVAEDSPLGSSARAQTMQAAERVIQQGFSRWMILRPAGLVGEGRHPGRFLAGKNDLAGAMTPVNLVHRDDVMAAIIWLLTKPYWGQCFNLCAPKYYERADFYPTVAKAQGLLAPIFSSQPQRGKRVSSDKLQRLGFRYQYPDLLAAFI